MLLFQLQVREELVVSSTGFEPTAEGFLNGFGVRSLGPKHLFASIVSVQGWPLIGKLLLLRIRLTKQMSLLCNKEKKTKRGLMHNMSRSYCIKPNTAKEKSIKEMEICFRALGIVALLLTTAEWTASLYSNVLKLCILCYISWLKSTLVKQCQFEESFLFIFFNASLHVLHVPCFFALWLVGFKGSWHPCRCLFGCSLNFPRLFRYNVCGLIKDLPLLAQTLPFHSWILSRALPLCKVFI